MSIDRAVVINKNGGVKAQGPLCLGSALEFPVHDLKRPIGAVGLTYHRPHFPGLIVGIAIVSFNAVFLDQSNVRNI